MKKNIPWDLIISKLEHKISADDDRFLAEWLCDDEHLKIYEEIHQVWQKVQERTQGYIPATDFYWKELSKRLDLPSNRKSIKSFPIRNFYKVAACIAFLICSVSFYIGMAWDNEAFEQKYTNVSGKSKVVLPDGSIVWLHSNTTLTYNSDFKEDNRSVRLEGEAFFEVTKDKKNRFIVHADGIDIAVYGTRFNVSSISAEKKVSISLLSGSIALKTSKNVKEQFLVPGETATYDKASQQVSITKGNSEMSAAWISPSVQFAKATLSEICEVLSKRYDIKINIDPSVGEKHLYTFTLHDESVEEILELMSSINPITYSFENSETINIKR